MPQLASHRVVTASDLNITSNGSYRLFESGTISSNNNKAVDVSLEIHSFNPDRSAAGQAIMTMLLERLDDAGNWRPLFALHEPVRAIAYDASENNGVIPTQQITFGPNVFNLESGRAFDTWDGVSIIAQDHQKRGILPSKFRVAVIVHEVAYGNAGAFASAEFSLDYELNAE